MDHTPPAFRFFIKSTSLSLSSYQYLVLILTFFAYTSYHATRKTTSIVKTVLDPAETNNVGIWLLFNPQPQVTTGRGWAPFDGPHGPVLLGVLDLSFLAVYSIGMYFAGHLGDRLDLRIFLTIGMVGTSIFTSLFGVGYWLNIHVFGYFLVVQMLAGLFQSTGWPSVVAIVGNWHGKRKRGLIMGIWNAHTSVGNILGSLIASLMLKYGWGWSFVVPSLLMAFVGLILFMLLPPGPESVGLRGYEIRNGVREPLLGEEQENGKKRKAIGFWEAWRIPGVTAFAFGLFFSKLVAYTFLYWLPFYISHTEIGGEYLSNWKAGMLSTLFDVGGIVGGILAGHLSDSLDARAFTSVLFTFLSMGALFVYRYFGSSSLLMNVTLMVITGMFVNGPYALITTAVSADLGTHESLSGDSRALATVTAIIDGTGSAGAAIGPLLTGYISSKSWDGVFGMLMVAALFAGLLLSNLAWAEIKKNELFHCCFRRRNSSGDTANRVPHSVNGV